MNQPRFSLMTLVSAALGLSACSSGGGDDRSAQTGTLSVQLMDAPVEDVAEVHVEIAGLRIKPAEGPAVDLDMGAPTVTVDLLALTDANAAVLVEGAEIPAGRYEWLEMTVNADHDGEMDSYVLTQHGGMEELRVPSGRVRLVSGFEVAGGEAVRFLFDWSARHGLVDPPGLAGWLLKPAFRVLRIDEFAVLEGTVAALTLDHESCTNDDDVDIGIGNVVYVYEGLGVTPFDIDGADPEPHATAAVAQNTAGDYVYRVLLMPGDYTVALSCEAGNDLPESSEPLAFLSPTDVALGIEGAVVDFEPEPN